MELETRHMEACRIKFGSVLRLQSVIICSGATLHISGNVAFKLRSGKQSQIATSASGTSMARLGRADACTLIIKVGIMVGCRRVLVTGASCSQSTGATQTWLVRSAVTEPFGLGCSLCMAYSRHHPCTAKQEPFVMCQKGSRSRLLGQK
jgi:hypothetical protein